MTSEVIDKVSIKDTYENAAGKQKTRTITVRSMVNGGSEFINIHCGRGSVNLPKDKAAKVSKALTGLSWKQKAAAKDSQISKLEKELAALKKQLKK